MYVQGGTMVSFVMISPAKPQFIHPDLELDIVQPFGTLIRLDCSAAAAPSPDYAWTVPQSAQPVHFGPCLDVYFMREGQYNCTVSNEVDSIRRSFSFRKAGMFVLHVHVRISTCT